MMMLARSSTPSARLLRGHGGGGGGMRQLATKPCPPFLSSGCLLTRHRNNNNQSNAIIFRYSNQLLFGITRRIPQVRTTTSTTKAAAPQQPRKWSQRFKRIARVVKFLRIPAIVGSVYMLGYQQGVIECFRNPSMMEDRLLTAVLADVGVTKREHVTIFSSHDKPAFGLTKRGMLESKTLNIGNDIIRSASLYVRQQLAQAIHKVREKVPQDISDQQFRELCDQDSDVEFWRSALFRIEGENPELPWKYIIAESTMSNAFVTEILPQRMFITTAMFENFIANEDELAVILGHEISHLLLGHVSQRNALERTLRTLEVLLLSLDPTEGLASLGVIGGLMWIRRVLMASFSRDHELEADELGLKIAAMACYNTQRGSYVMKKMHDQMIQLAGEPTRYSNLLTMLDTHPPSLDRYNRLVEMSKTENPGAYRNECATIGQKMIMAVWK